MATAIESIVVTPGIVAGSPFAVGDVLYVAQVSPAVVRSTPNIFVDTTQNPQNIEIGPLAVTPHATVIGHLATVPAGGNGNQVAIGTLATVTETQDSIAIGHAAQTGVVVATNGAVAIGSNAAVGGAGANAGGGVAIGNGAVANNGIAIGAGAACLLGQVAVGASSTAENFAVAIGGGATARVGGAHGNGSVAIGRNASAGESTDIVVATGGGGTAAGQGGNVYLGGGLGGTGVTGHDNVVIGGSSNTGGGSAPASASGNFNTVLGGNSTSAHNGCRVFGRGIAPTADNQTIIGGLDDPCATVYFGNGAQAAIPQNVIVGVTGGDTSASNIIGANLTIAGGISRGTAAGGSIVFQTTPAGGVSGTTPNPLTTALTIDATQTCTFANPPVLPTLAPAGNVLTLTNGPTGTSGAATTYLQFNVGGTVYAVPAWAT